MRQKDATRMYMRELWGSIALYTVILIVAISFARGMAEGALRTAILLTPMIGFGLAIWAIVRHFGRMDEYIRRVQLENLGIATAVTAGLSFTYGFLETAGFPKLSMFWVWIVLGSSLVATNLLRFLLKR